MAVYMTKTWGFSSPSMPLQFSQRGRLDSARSLLKPGDLVVIVGTLGEETAAEDRGKILGLKEPTTKVVSSLDYKSISEAHERDQNGHYRWPHGLELVNAWRFSEPRKALADISNRHFGMDSASGIVLLEPHEAEAILRLPREPVPLLQSIRSEARVLGVEAARRRGVPPPSTVRIGIMHMRRAPAFTYVMELQGAATPSFKVGWAFDLKQRQRQFNQAAMPQIGGIQYNIKLQEFWDTAKEAYIMEQKLLQCFDKYRHPNNQEIITKIDYDSLQKEWIDYVVTCRADPSNKIL